MVGAGKGLSKHWVLLLLSQDYPEGLNSDTNEETLASGEASKVADLSWGRNGMSELVKIDFPPPRISGNHSIYA